MQLVQDDLLQAPGAERVRPQTVAQCHEVIDALMKLVSQLQQQLADQQQQIAWLQERVKLDSKTSSKPPSSDGPGSASRAQRRASGRKRGAQKGHPGSYRALIEEAQVDQIVDCPPPAVCECGGAVQVEGEPVRHQVFDAPVVRARVSEYRLHSGCCTACGQAPACEAAERGAERADRPAGAGAGGRAGHALPLDADEGPRPAG